MQLLFTSPGCGSFIDKKYLVIEDSKFCARIKLLRCVKALVQQCIAMTEQINTKL